MATILCDMLVWIVTLSAIHSCQVVKNARNLTISSMQRRSKQCSGSC